MALVSAMSVDAVSDEGLGVAQELLSDINRTYINPGSSGYR